jgi:hypothetical protein
MPTANPNPTVGPAWGKIVDVNVNFFLSLPFTINETVEVVTHNSTPPATLRGHPLRADKQQEMNRQIIGTGDVYARCLGGTFEVILTTWT